MSRPTKTERDQIKWLGVNSLNLLHLPCSVLLNARQRYGQVRNELHFFFFHEGETCQSLKEVYEERVLSYHILKASKERIPRECQIQFIVQIYNSHRINKMYEERVLNYHIPKASKQRIQRDYQIQFIVQIYNKVTELTSLFIILELYKSQINKERDLNYHILKASKEKMQKRTFDVIYSTNI